MGGGRRRDQAKAGPEQHVVLSSICTPTRSIRSSTERNRLTDLIRKAKEFEMPALALTDHGCMYGAWNFQKKAKANELKPILGMEAYVAPGDRRETDPVGPGAERPPTTWCFSQGTGSGTRTW